MWYRVVFPIDTENWKTSEEKQVSCAVPNHAMRIIKGFALRLLPRHELAVEATAYGLCVAQQEDETNSVSDFKDEILPVGFRL